MATPKRTKCHKTELFRSITSSSVSEVESAPPETSIGGPQKQSKKVLPPPTEVPPGTLLPDDLAVWDNAVLLIDKPKGWTSFDVCGKLRGSLGGLLRRQNRKIKVGHAGTLDPMATGLLIVCIGKATKSIDNFVAMKKEYSGVLRLGEATASYDAESNVILTKPWEHITDEALLQARTGFLGNIEQLPPMFSAIKIAGKRLYESAREGKEVERKRRNVSVDRFDLERDVDSPQNVKFYIECSKGTYVRSLAHDLGFAAGTAAHLTVLRREAIGEFRVGSAWAMDDLVAALENDKEKRAAAL
ncbi:putative tRNA pseudouridine synthase B [Nannochloris sp. 'desiccata']|nr:putative tRNA pseudouridine synthase B [Chlorella desiccata (nom. nud.)]